MSAAPAATERVVMRWRGRQSAALAASAREVCIEGALRASKTTLGVWRELSAAIEHPGIHLLLARWTDAGAFGQLLPVWHDACRRVGLTPVWHADEAYDLLPNGSRAYVRGLKAQDAVLRYAKFRGLTLGRVYVDQAEELPHDIYLELAARLSQPGYPHQITITPQAVDEDHWIAREFPTTGLPAERQLFQLSVFDNAHNLDPSVIPALLRLYPPEHPKHRTLILGRRGMNVIGEPVYAGAFVRRIHERLLSYDPALPLEAAIDFGKHHPCIVWRQVSPLGQVRFLGGILGQDLYLGDFAEVARRYQEEWFPHPAELRVCCDPAGATDTSQGTTGAVALLRERGYEPVWVVQANAPAVRLAAIERLADRMRRRAADGSEALAVQVAPERWLQVSPRSTTTHRFVADGFEAGYVWDPHVISVAHKPMRRPKKDGWYEHGMNCVEYLEVNFSRLGSARQAAEAPPLPAYTPRTVWG